jgi:hypothetical protein
MDIEDRTFWEKLLSPVMENFSAISSDSEGTSAALYLIGEHMRDSPQAFTVVERVVDDFLDLEDRDVKVELLNTTTKMFLSHPLELQLMLGGLLEMAVSDSDLEVKGRACFLYRLLESGVDNAKAVLLTMSSPLIQI